MLGRGLADPLPLDLWIFQMLAVTGMGPEKGVITRWIIFFMSQNGAMKWDPHVFFLGGNPKLMLKCMYGTF